MIKKCSDLKCIQKPTQSRISLTQHCLALLELKLVQHPQTGIAVNNYYISIVTTTTTAAAAAAAAAAAW